MDAQVLLRINAQEERFLPVEIKVGMLMEQAAMRMRASAIVGDRIAKLDDAIRVRALLAIIREKTSGCGQGSSSSASDDADGKREGSSNPSSPVTTACRAGVVCASQPGEEDNDIFTRMAVSAMKTVLFQISEESKPESAKDVEDLYEGLVTTAELSLAAAEGFPTLDVDSLMSLKQARYRKLAAARHRFLVRKIGVLLDMEKDLDTLLDLAADTEALRDSFADVDLTTPDDEEGAKPSPEGLDAAAASSDPDKPLSVSFEIVPTPSAKSRAMSSLRNTSWDKEPGNDDATEDETDEETPPQGHQIAEISPSH